MSNLTEFRRLQRTMISEAITYEENGSYEMAYISLWSVLEQGLHLYANDALKYELHERVKKWDHYLNGNTRNKPKEIKNFKTEYTSHSIPQVSLIEKILGKMKQVEKVLDTKGKWRDRRNKIAHQASRFINEDKYKEYKHELIKAIDLLSRKAALYETSA